MLIILVLIFGLYLVKIAPYHIYTLTLTEGVNTRFLKMKPSTKSYYDGNEYQELQVDSIQKLSDGLYKNFHIKNFLIPLPIGNSTFSMIPKIKTELMQLKLGAQFLDQKNIEHFDFVIEREIKFETENGNQEIFLLPYFKNYINKKNINEIWKDLFSRKLSLPSNEGKGFYESLKILDSVSYQELVYNLYVLFNRTKLIPPSISQMQYYENSNIGIVRFEESNSKLLSERIYILNQGIIYPISMKTKLDSPMGRFYRNKFIKDIMYKNSNKDSSIAIYAEYKNLEYVNRIDQKGMIYLYSAWSHDLENKDFIRIIINFLERGKSNIKYLRPFYEYAYKHFGSSFSGESEFLLESNTEKLKRKMNEELEQEISKELKVEKTSSDGTFSSSEEKIKYNLQKAKENKINSDDKSNQLSIE